MKTWLKQWWPLGVVVVFATIALAQVLGPGEFSTLLVEGDSTLGDGTAKDITITFDDNNVDCKLLWDESTGYLTISGCAASIIGTSTQAQMIFDAPDTSGEPIDGEFSVFVTDATASSEDTEFQISTVAASAKQNRVIIKDYDGSGSGAIDFVGVGGATATVGYSGTGGDLNTHYDAGVLYAEFDKDIAVAANAGDGIVMQTPGGTCYLVTIDNTPAMAFSAVTCP